MELRKRPGQRHVSVIYGKETERSVPVGKKTNSMILSVPLVSVSDDRLHLEQDAEHLGWRWRRCASGEAMTRVALFSAILWTTTIVTAQSTQTPHGTWLQDGIKWSKAPKEINPKLSSGRAAIAYFGPNGTFALIYATVNRVQGEDDLICNGCGHLHGFLGTSREDGNSEVSLGQSNRAGERREVAWAVQRGCRQA